MYSFGYVALVGKANAGKSSLINSLVGEKVAIVSAKPQTTRDNILGILNGENYQVVFIDTPGVHHSKNYLDKAMIKNVRTALAGVDLVLYLLDGTKLPDEEEIDYIEHIDSPKLIIRTKTDKKGQKEFASDLGVSVVSCENLDTLKQMIINRMPKHKEKNFPFEQDEYTDKSLRFIIAEQVREEALKLFNDEIPHGIAVVITRFEEKPNLTIIECELVCENARHKGMIIGKGGGNLKKIGQNTRAFAEELLAQKVLIKIFVKVEENWRNKPQAVKKMGY